ncbi:aldehyde dehydrogenase family protein [bacterium]|nr:aldehyde dehydrogenase family protein [bacterium]
MSEHFSLMIPGATAAGKTEIRAPFNQTVIATVDKAGWDALETALSRAYKLYLNRDHWIPKPERLAILGGLKTLMAERHEELSVEAAREGGKPLLDSRVEVTRAIDSIQICIDTMRTEGGREIPMNVNAASLGKLAVTRREPIGVVVAYSAFNHPVNLIAHQVGPAIAAGCPVIVKPAEAAPLSCFRFVKLLYEAGLPEEWCQACLANSHDLSIKLIGDKRVAFLSFIGSAEVGWMLRSKLAPGARCSLENGGVAPVIVDATADIDAAIEPLAKGGFYHAGQVCVSVQRIYVHESVAEEFAEKLAARAKQLVVGDPTLDTTEVGPLIRPKEVDRVETWVQEAVEHGAKLLCGGRRVSDTCYECTVLFDPPDDVMVSRAEVFGPVVCVYSYKNMDKAIERANALPYSFQAAIYTNDLNTALRGYARLNGSTIMVNEHTAFRVDWMPFGGLKESGLGVGGIPYTIHDMTIEKMLVIKSGELKL